MKRLISTILSALVFLATPALAKSDDAGAWKVSQQSGDVRVVHRGLQAAALKGSTALTPGDLVITGASGRATLARGSDYIVIAPRSELRLPAAAQPAGFTRVIQQLGTMLYKVRHTGVPHFAVDTPMLAAVVKGTTFTVIVEQDRSAVQVIEGAVQVTASDGGMQRLVEGGRTVFIDRKEPKQLITADAETLGTTDSSSETSVTVTGSEGESLATVAGLTEGLVRADVVPASATDSAAGVGAVIASITPAKADGALLQPGDTQTATDPAVPGPTVTDGGVAVPPVSVPGVQVGPVTVQPGTVTVAVPPITVTGPLVELPAVTVPPVTVTVPTVTVPPVTVTVPTVTLPPVTLPPVTVTVPPVTLPPVTLPPVTVPSVTVPPVTLPPVTLPPVTLPPVTVPPVTVTVPPVTLPPVTLPPVTVPPVTVPPVTVTLPPVTLPPIKLF